MSTVLYEHPLNERIRNYLKLEQLLFQVTDCLSCKINTSYNTFFTSLFAILDTLERNDIRGDLIKDLEKLEANMLAWAQLPDVDTDALKQNQQQAHNLISALKTPVPVWCQLKEHKLLASIKQRFAIQGGSSTFDLPQLQFWLNQDEQTVNQDIDYWLAQLDDFKQALALVLKFIRQRNNFELIETESGFYQDSGEGILLLRIRLDKNADYYPTVSGNKFRYSIRFMLPCEHQGRKYANTATKFELARC